MQCGKLFDPNINIVYDQFTMEMIDCWPVPMNQKQVLQYYFVCDPIFKRTGESTLRADISCLIALALKGRK